MPVGVLLERERRELVEVGGVGVAGQGEQEEAAEVAGLEPQVVRAGRRGGSASSTSAAIDGGDEQPGALAGRVGVGAERGRRRGAAASRQAVAGGDRDLDGAVVARARLAQLRGAVRAARRAARRAGARWLVGGRRGTAERAQLGQQVAQASAASNASPRRRAVDREHHALERRCRRPDGAGPPRPRSRAASASGKPPTPVPNATSARLRAPSSSALASVAAVARRMMSALRRPAELHRGGVDHPAARHVAARGLDRLAEPDRRLRVGLLLDGAAAGARDRARDAAAVRAARVLAALAIASTSSAVMSVSSTSIVAIELRYRP